jgi:hypothetical protein
MCFLEIVTYEDGVVCNEDRRTVVLHYHSDLPEGVTSDGRTQVTCELTN